MNRPIDRTETMVVLQRFCNGAPWPKKEKVRAFGATKEVVSAYSGGWVMFGTSPS
jgi:hypothetical protein